MKRRLFLTGEMGVGKSTAISIALGEKLSECGGFLTRRQLDESGQIRSFSLAACDGSREETFLDLTGEIPKLSLDVFGTLGVSCLRGEALVLDEIGGVELLDDRFWKALEEVMKNNVPILGVLKGSGPAGALIQKLGLEAEYVRCWEMLWNILSQDENTCIYTCGQFDRQALELAGEWGREYAYE